MPLSCGLGHRRTSTLQGLHIAFATHKCGISSKSRVHPSINAPCIPPHKPSSYNPIIHHYPCLPDIQTSFLQAVPHGINWSLPRPTHWATTSALPYIYPLSNAVILSTWPNPRRTTSSIFFSSTPFVTRHNCFIREFGTSSILLITANLWGCPSPQLKS